MSNVRLRGGGVGAIRESAEQEQDGTSFAVGRVRVVRVMIGGVVLVWDIGCMGGRCCVGVQGAL